MRMVLLGLVAVLLQMHGLGFVVMHPHAPQTGGHAHVFVTDDDGHRGHAQDLTVVAEAAQDVHPEARTQANRVRRDLVLIVLLAALAGLLLGSAGPPWRLRTTRTRRVRVQRRLAMLAVLRV